MYMYDDHKLQILVTTCTKRKVFFVSAEYEYVQVNVLMHTHKQIHVCLPQAVSTVLTCASL